MGSNSRLVFGLVVELGAGLGESRGPSERGSCRISRGRGIGRMSPCT